MDVQPHVVYFVEVREVLHAHGARAHVVAVLLHLHIGGVEEVDVVLHVGPLHGLRGQLRQRLGGEGAQQLVAPEQHKERRPQRQQQHHPQDHLAQALSLQLVQPIHQKYPPSHICMARLRAVLLRIAPFFSNCKAQISRNFLLTGGIFLCIIIVACLSAGMRSQLRGKSFPAVE